MALNLVKWVKATSESYKQLREKDNNSLYFLEDTGELYKGEKSYTEAVIYVEDFPETGAKGKLYIKNSTSEAKVWDGTWKVFSIVVEQSIDDESTTTNAVSGKAIKAYIEKKISEIPKPEVQEIEPSKDEGNKLEKKKDGLYVSFKDDMVTKINESEPSAEKMVSEKALVDALSWGTIEI